MERIRFGIIGLGHIGRHHAGYLLEGKVGRGELTAVTASKTAPTDRFKGLKTFSTGEELILSGAVDAVIVATPHYQHTALAIAALENGVHTLVEKPISAHKADAQRLIAAHQRRPAVRFAAMFQMRTEPHFMKMRELFRSGDLGDLVRVNWINTDWFRTNAYFAGSEWRATWKGEGGGALLNQCLHNLDILQWLCGMPARLRGFCQFGRYHPIEVEDNVTAYLEWPNGATGVFVGSTGETPGTNRFEIAGTRGRLMLERGRLELTRNETDMVEFTRSAKQGFAQMASQTTEVPFENASDPHARVTQNFVNAILDGEPLIAPGEEGIHSLELANAIVLSSLLGQTLDLPMDGAAWERKLHELISGSKSARKEAAFSAEDVTNSFK